MKLNPNLNNKRKGENNTEKTDKLSENKKGITKIHFTQLPLPEIPKDEKFKEIKEKIEFFRSFQADELSDEYKIFKNLSDDAKKIVNVISKIVGEKENPSSLKKFINIAMSFIC